jgi:NAD(P)-dependent dehydrogenase (short-subunit alcohol dehydrogenase family)
MVEGYLAELFSLRGLVAVVTGGSSGIGRAIAAALGGASASVVLVARGERALDEAAGELERAGSRAAWVAADLADRAALRRAAEDATRPFGEPDILVNAAGVNLRPPLEALADEDWDRTRAASATCCGYRFGALGDLGAGGVAHALQQVRGQLQAHVQHRELLAVLRHDPVGGPVDGVDAADRGRLLPGQRPIGAELAPSWSEIALASMRRPSSISRSIACSSPSCRPAGGSPTRRPAGSRMRNGSATGGRLSPWSAGPAPRRTAATRRPVRS